MATTLAPNTAKVIERCRALASEVLEWPAQHMWVDYDDEADVVYVSFRRPQRARKTIELDTDTLLHKDGRTIVGVTILNASTRR